MVGRRLAPITVSAVILLAVAVLEVEGYGGRIGGRTVIKDVKTNKEVQQLGRFCVEEYNRSATRGGGGNLKFTEVIEAEKQVVAGMKYFLRISAIQNEESKIYESVVMVKPWLRSKELLDFAPTRNFITNKF